MLAKIKNYTHNTPCNHSATCACKASTPIIFTPQ